MPLSDDSTHDRLNSVDDLRALTDSELLETLLETDLGLTVIEVDAFVAGLRDWPSCSKPAAVATIVRTASSPSQTED